MKDTATVISPIMVAAPVYKGCMGAAWDRQRGPDGRAATLGFLTGQKAERKRGREGLTATFVFLSLD